MASMMSERVQDVANSVTKFSTIIPEEFIRVETEQPGITTVSGKELEVPTVDFSNPDEENLLSAIAEASKNWGMFQIVNHGIPNDVISKLQKVGEEFFLLPREEKEVYAKLPGSKSIEGYGTKLQKEADGKKGWVDHLFHKIWPPSSIDHRLWPQKPSSYREANEEYAKYMQEVVDKLLRSLSLGLGLEGSEMKEAFGGEKLEYLLKINYYPPCPRPDLALGVVAHTDMCTCTILGPNHVQGLQAFRDGRWFNVKYIPNALVVHIGDQIEILSNGIYKSVLHRTTVNKEESRMSWPVFIEPAADMEIGTHPKLVGQDKPPKYKTKKYRDYVYCKLNKLPQ